MVGLGFRFILFVYFKNEIFFKKQNEKKRRTKTWLVFCYCINPDLSIGKDMKNTGITIKRIQFSYYVRESRRSMVINDMDNSDDDELKARLSVLDGKIDV